jgi:hypothetical protein
MTSTGSISVTQGTDTVNLTTGHNCAVKTMLNNPFFTMSLPNQLKFSDGGAASNVVVINLNMMTHRWNLTFDLLDGVDAGSEYEKLVDMFGSGKSITFVYANRTYTPVFIEQADLGTSAGKDKILQGCTMTLVWASTLSAGIGDLPT